jgi:transcriptional regulator with XRE-family HTH domain
MVTDICNVTITFRGINGVTMTDLKEKFVKKLKRLREEKGLAQEELARKADIHRTTLDKLEREVQGPSLDTLQKLAEALDVEPWELLKFED